MDPVTASLNLLSKILDFGMKIYDKMPEEMQIQGAKDWGDFTHNIASQVLKLQSKINSL